jgi:macrolide transport system ATP-binding/permease protein
MFRRRRSAEDFAEEIKAHLALEEDELKSEGVGKDEARRRARSEFGSVSAARERFYLKDRIKWLDNLARDARFAIRQLIKNPGFALAAIVVLALGMGVSVAIFGFVDAALLEPLPYANPGRLMSVNENGVASSRWPLSYPDYLDWQRINKSFSSLDVYAGTGFLLRTSSGAEPVQAERVSGGFFETLGVHPILGRDFYVGENRPDGPNVTLLSYGAWLRRFGGREDIVGRTVSLDNNGYTVIGVLPRAFNFAPGGNTEFWVPLNHFSNHEKMRTFYNFWGVGRLRDGVGIASAQAEITGIAQNLQRQYGITGRKLDGSVVPLSEIIVGDVRPILLTLLGGAVLLLLIACVNVVSLVLVRSESRRREIAVRGALGATRGRLVRQFVTEGLLIALFGSIAGAMVASITMRLLGRLVPKDMADRMPFLGSVGLNAHTAAFAAGIALMAALMFAAIPALRLLSNSVREGLADGDRSSAGRLWRRLGANMVVVELAVAVTLLVAAGLLGRSFYRLLHVSLGFEPGHVATMQVMAPGNAYQSADQTIGLYREIVRRVSGLPGVQSAGLTSMLPAECDCASDDPEIVGKPSHGEHKEVDERHVSPDYLHALGASLVRGRYFTDADDASHPGVAVINEAMAREFFPGQDPIGRKLSDEEGGIPTQWEIVGVIDDVREGPLDADISPAEYFPINQARQDSFTLVARTSQDAATLLPLLVETIRTIDPSIGVSDEATMDAKIDGTQAALLHRFAAWLVGGFAAMALLLGIVGLYGVIAYSVSRRTREIGVRMALGAQRTAVQRMVVREAAILALAGIVIGCACALAAGRLMRGLLFGVRAWDLPTLVGVSIALGAAALLASYIPARRAAAVNPADALRAE